MRTVYMPIRSNTYIVQLPSLLLLTNCQLFQCFKVDINDIMIHGNEHQQWMIILRVLSDVQHLEVLHNGFGPRMVLPILRIVLQEVQDEVEQLLRLLQ